MTNQLLKARNDFLSKHPEQRITVNGREWGTFHVNSSNSETSPALVLIPGTLGRGDIFWQQINALKDRVNILALTYPDSGGIIEWSSDVASLMDRMKMGKATILGSSLGGFLAQYFTASNPTRVDNLIAANTLSSVIGLDQIPPYRFDLQETPIKDLRQGFTDGLSMTAQQQPELADLIELLELEVNGRILEPEMRARLQALKTGPALAQIDIPKENIFTVESQDDRLIPLPMREEVRKQLKPIRSFRFQYGSHFPYVVRAREYIALLEEVLNINITETPWPDGYMSVR